LLVALELARHVRAPLRELHQRGPSVGGVGLAAHEAGLDQRVDQAGDVAGTDPERVGQLALGRGATNRAPYDHRMITALHTLIYADDPDAARAFFRDVLGLPGADTGGGWLIFKTGSSELGLHPSSWEHEGRSGSTDQQFDVSLMCDDLPSTMAELTAKGAEFVGEVSDQGWGVTARLKVPGAGEITLYEPRYDPPATSL
jgi:catechol 2,3-dioxygenase-like lactoylglutathione lyase family enzyme